MNKIYNEFYRNTEFLKGPYVKKKLEVSWYLHKWQKTIPWTYIERTLDVQKIDVHDIFYAGGYFML